VEEVERCCFFGRSLLLVLLVLLAVGVAVAAVPRLRSLIFFFFLSGIKNTNCLNLLWAIQVIRSFFVVVVEILRIVCSFCVCAMLESPIHVRFPPSSHPPESPLYNVTLQSLAFLDVATHTNIDPTLRSPTSSARQPPPLDKENERQHLQNPLHGYEPFFTSSREMIDFDDINGAWLKGKEKSQQARLVLAEKRMLRRLKSKCC
jgi:hypothetical protein